MSRLVGLLRSSSIAAAVARIVVQQDSLAESVRDSAYSAMALEAAAAAAEEPDFKAPGLDLVDLLLLRPRARGAPETLSAAAAEVFGEDDCRRILRALVGAAARAEQVLFSFVVPFH